MLVWFGVQFVRQGIYQGGIFRFTVVLPQNFPDGECPVRCYFLNYSIPIAEVVLIMFQILESYVSNSSLSSFDRSRIWRFVYIVGIFRVEEKQQNLAINTIHNENPR